MITRHSYCDEKIIFVRIISYIKSDFVEEQHLHFYFHNTNIANIIHFERLQMRDISATSY